VLFRVIPVSVVEGTAHHADRIVVGFFDHWQAFAILASSEYRISIFSDRSRVARFAPKAIPRVEDLVIGPNPQDVIAVLAAARPRHEIWTNDGLIVVDRLLGRFPASCKHPLGPPRPRDVLRRT